MNKYLKFFLGFIFLVVLVDLMLIDRKKDKQDMMVLSATFNKVDGLNVGANVMISGINVGFVENISLENSYPKITMMVNKNLKISNLVVARRALMLPRRSRRRFDREEEALP